MLAVDALMPWPSSWTPASTRWRCPRGARRRCRGRRAGRPPRRGGAALAVLAVDAVAVQADAPRHGGAALAVLAVDVVASRGAYLDAAAPASLDLAVLAVLVVDIVAELGPTSWPSRWTLTAYSGRLGHPFRSTRAPLPVTWARSERSDGSLDPLAPTSRGAGTLG